MDMKPGEPQTVPEPDEEAIADVAPLQVELYPHYPGLLSGIRDQFGNNLPFPSAFRL
jgi:hypothetical protein